MASSIALVVGSAWRRQEVAGLPVGLSAAKAEPVASYCREVAGVLVLFSTCILVYTGSSAEYLYVHPLLLLSIWLSGVVCCTPRCVT